MIRKSLATALMIVSSTAGFAAGTTGWAVPTRIDLTYAGIMVYGSFGNPGGCTTADRLFVPINTGQYKEIYATLMMAMASGNQVAAYVSSCDSVGWYAAPTVTFNYMNNAGILYTQKP